VQQYTALLLTVIFCIIKQIWCHTHRRSHDFLWGCTFSPKKLTTIFWSSPSKHRLKLQNNHSYRPDLPDFLKNGLLLCLEGARSAWRGALTTFSCKFGQKNFSAIGMHVHPPATSSAMKSGILRRLDSKMFWHPVLLKRSFLSK